MKKLTIVELIEKFQEIHHHTYNYSLVKEYKNFKSKIKIICDKRNEFSQRIDLHLLGNGCKRCRIESMWTENSIKFFKKDLNIINYK
jgi:hypothetical protein